jgi:ferritin
MKMNEDLAKLFNDQITMELASSVAYLQMAAHLETEGLSGMGAWMRIQSDEEHLHALRFLQYTLDRGNDVAIGAMEAPVRPKGSVADVFDAALAQEQRVTASISELYAAAQSASDVLALPFLQEFLTEQVEEEATVGEIIDRLRLAGGDGPSMLQLDRELGSRTPGAE